MATAVTPCRCGCSTTDKGTKISHMLKGRIFSDSTLKRMAEGQTRRFQDGMSVEHREAIRVSQTGVKHKPDCRHCVAIRGANHPRWKNGASQKDIRRRLAQYGGEFDPTVLRRNVLEKDSWTCWLCNEPIPDLVWDNTAQPRYGTIDHIVPISRGGDHTWFNVRAAHLRCNSVRWYLDG